VHVRAQVSARGHLEGLADVEHQGAGHGGCLEPAAVIGPHLEAGLSVLEHEGEPAVVLVAADALAGGGPCGLACRWCGVAHELRGRHGLVVEPLVEPRGVLPEGLGEQCQHAARHPPGLVEPAKHGVAQLGHFARPLVRADEAQVGGVAVTQVESRALGADVDLLAQVGGAGGVLGGQCGVAAKVWRVEVGDLAADGLWQGEEGLRRREDIGLDLGGDAVPGDVEETELVGRGAQLLQQVGALGTGAGAGGAAEVDRRESELAVRGEGHRRPCLS